MGPAEGNQITDAIVSGKLTLFCGAGISAEKPSRLPLASRLVEKIQSDYLRDFGKDVHAAGLRPEVLFHLISKHDPVGLLARLELNLGSVRPNANHQFAATCLALGNHVITTNFDLLIEIACLARGVPTNRITERLPATDEHVLFKIHGSLDRAESIFYTINHVYRGLGEQRLRTLRALTNRRIMLVIGYSGLDQLDIMPAIRKCNPARIYWFNHVGTARWCSMQNAQQHHIATLPRLHYFDGNTQQVVAQLDRRLTPHLRRKARDTRIPRARRVRIGVDILMHENRYARVRDLIDDNKVRGDLHCEIAHFEATSSISKRTPAWHKKRDRMLAKLFHLPIGKQRPFLGTMAKFVTSERLLDRLASIVEKEIAANRPASENVLEAAIEIIYEYIWRRRYSEAEVWLGRLQQITRRSGSLLTEARRCIEEALFCHDVYCNVTGDEKHLRRGTRAANKALFLLAEDMFADAFFYNQARVNKANLLRAKGRFDKALSLYKAAERYFGPVSINSTLLVKYERANLYFLKGDLSVAQAEIRTFLNKSRSAGRRLWLGFVDRLRAQILLAHRQQKGRGPLLKIRRLLRRSIKHFRKEGNRAEAQASIALLNQIK